MREWGETGDLVGRLREQTDCAIETVKVALTSDQFEQWFRAEGQDRLPYDPNPIKESDSRSPWFRRHYGDHGAELDAVPMDRLRALLVEQLGQLIDRDAYQWVLARQAHDQVRLARALSRLTLSDEVDEP
jgi:hypothetical protein